MLPTLESESVDMVCTSPPYWGLRDYGHDGQLGLEATPDEYVKNIVAVFRDVRRVLRPAGTCWLNLGDSYSTDGGRGAARMAELGRTSEGAITPAAARGTAPGFKTGAGLKEKDLVGVPWRVAFALQADGWYLRSDIIWSKPNPMPESVTDRPTKSHEYVFLLSKQPQYWFDAEAVREPSEMRPQNRNTNGRGVKDEGFAPHQRARGSGGQRPAGMTNPAGRNVRSVWEIATQPYPEAHFATFPEALARRCILAGCPEWVCGTCRKARERLVETERLRPAAPSGNRETRRWDAEPEGQLGGRVARYIVGWSDCGHGDYRPGVVLDPFLGSGTTALVARQHGRRCVGVELSPEYAALAARRCSQLSLLADGAA